MWTVFSSDDSINSRGFSFRLEQQSRRIRSVALYGCFEQITIEFN